MIAPIFVLTPTGRTGTTLLMALLNRHPDIVLQDKYPYELRALQNEMYSGSYVDGMDVMASPAMRLYTDISKSQNKSINYIAEKLIGLQLSSLISSCKSTRLLATVRDPRDILMSIIAFDAQRGSRGFALNDHDDMHSAVVKIGGAFSELVSVLRDNDSVCTVRYEHLIMDQAAAMSRVAERLGLAPFPPGDSPQHPVHTTSTTAEVSIGRWRSEMSQETQDLCWSEWADLLHHFNYPRH